MTKEIKKNYDAMFMFALLLLVPSVIIFYKNPQQLIFVITSGVLAILIMLTMEIPWLSRISTREFTGCKADIVRCIFAIVVGGVLFAGIHDKFYNSDIYVRQVKETLGVKHRIELQIPDVSLEEELCEKVRIDAVEQLLHKQGSDSELRVYPVSETTDFKQLSELCAMLNKYIQQFDQVDVTDAKTSAMVLDAVDAIEEWEYTAAYKGNAVALVITELVSMSIYMLLILISTLKLLFSRRKPETEAYNVE